MLTILLERPGELVTREELREKLWAEDTFVEFDSSLNTAIQKIRQALGDSATNPRFLETVPRQGYRFVAPVEFVGAQHAVPETAYAGGRATEGDAGPLSSSNRASRRWRTSSVRP